MITKWANRFELKPGRWIYEPSAESIEIGKTIKAELEEKWRPPGYYFHLRSGGHLAAIAAHSGNSTLWHGDIENFFGSINRSRLTRCLKPLIGYERAREWSFQSTVPGEKKGTFVLPYGFVQSQLLASLCLRHSALGSCLHKLRKTCAISIYVDDMIVSSNDRDLVDEAEQIEQSAFRAGFRLNAAKLQGPAPEITAFNISVRQHELELTDERWAEFDAALRDPACSDERRRAIVAYISKVDPARLGK